MLFHGIHKVIGGISGLPDMLAKHNLPGALSWGVYAGEVLAPILLIVGFLTRPGAIILAIDMIAAIYLAKMDVLTSIEPRSGGWALETEAFYLFGAIAIFCLGSGRFALSGGRGRLN